MEISYSDKKESIGEGRELPLFIALTFVFSSFWVFLAWLLNDENFSILAVFMPSLVATGLTRWIHGRSGLGQLLRLKKIPLKWGVISLLTVPILAYIALLIQRPLNGPPLSLRTTELLPAVIVILLISFGEEYGWRGYLLPRLQKRYSALTSSLFVGVIWGIWHFPASLIGTGVPLEMPFWVFMLWVIGASILITWIFNHTQSVFAAILFHSSANATFNYLWLLPEFVGQLQTFWFFLGVLGIVTAVIILYFGSTQLKRIAANDG